MEKNNFVIVIFCQQKDICYICIATYLIHFLSYHFCVLMKYILSMRGLVNNCN